MQYMNSHPLYIQLIKFLDQHIIPLAKRGTGVLNLTMIVSLLLAVPFLFLLLRYFALPRWYAVVMSLVILFLSPQLDRMAGHFEMVYAFFIPLYWYLLLRWDEDQKPWLWGSLLLLTALVGGFTSAYYVAFFLVFSLAYGLVQVWINRKNLRAYYRKGLVLFTIAVLPVLLVRGLVAVTDWVNDRPDNPWGFFIFHSNIWSIFLPFHSDVKELLRGTVDLDFQWEGRAFVGLPATLLVLSVGYFLVHSLITRQKPDLRTFFPNRHLNAWLGASVLVLLFSMCLPFKWGFQFLVDVLPPLKQFRCLGRFSWIFYYVFTLYSAYFFYTLYRRLKLKRQGMMGSIILLLVIGVWLVDAGTNIKRSTRHIFNQNWVLSYDDEAYLEKFRQAGIDPGQFQAIFFLPFTNTSGDKLLHPRGHNAFSYAMECSFHTGIPLIQSFSPRLSFEHALSSVQLLAAPSIYKTRIHDMNDKPVLLVITKEELKGEELRLRERAEIFYEDDKVCLARLPVEDFNSGHVEWMDHARSMADSLSVDGNVLTDRPGVIYKGFNDNPAHRVFSGQGAAYLKKGQLRIYDGKLPEIQAGLPMEISFWLYVDHRTFSMPEAELHLWDNQGQHLERIKLETREVHDVYGKWVRIKHRLVPESGIRCQLLLRGKYMTVDDLLIRPVESNVMVRMERDFDLFNNYPLSK
jgi:hypothetical protein